MNRSAELPLGSTQALDRAELELGAPLRFSVSCRRCLLRCDKPVGVERTEWVAPDGRCDSSQRDEFHRK